MSGESADSADSQMDTRVYQLDELNSQVPSGGQIGDAPNSPDSLSGAVVQTPNSVVEGSIGAHCLELLSKRQILIYVLTVQIPILL